MKTSCTHIQVYMYFLEKTQESMFFLYDNDDIEEEDVEIYFQSS